MYNLTACIRSTGLFPIPKDQAQGLLPKGYTPEDLLFGLAETPAGAIDVQMLACKDDHGAPAILFLLGVWAKPPTPIPPGPGRNEVLLGSAHGANNTADLFTRWNLTPVSVADLALPSRDANGFGQTQVSAEGIQFSSVTVNQPTASTWPVPIRYFAVEGGTTRGLLDLEPNAAAAADDGPAALTGSSYFGHSIPATGPGLAYLMPATAYTLKPVPLPQ